MGSIWTPDQAEAGANLLANSAAQISQEFGSAMSETLAAGAAQWTLDQVYVDMDTTGEATVSRQAFAAGAAPVAGVTHHLRVVQSVGSGGGTTPYVLYPVEGVETAQGENLRVSFWASVASGTLEITPKIRQDFGSGGSPSADVTTAGSTVTVTTTWELHSVVIPVPSTSGKTLGSTAGTSYIAVELHAPTATTYTLDLVGWAAWLGSQARTWQCPDEGEEWRTCRQWMWSTFHRGTAWADNAGFAHVSIAYRIPFASSSSPMGVVPFARKMARLPTCTAWNPASTGDPVRNATAGTNETCSLIHIGDESVNVHLTSAAAAFDQLFTVVSADARIAL